MILMTLKGPKIDVIVTFFIHSGCVVVYHLSSIIFGNHASWYHFLMVKMWVKIFIWYLNMVKNRNNPDCSLLPTCGGVSGYIWNHSSDLL